ncbi:MAG: tRNA (adenosine(37)-N6)-threonylcarbamoyltransferase complex dimerization subunit type 1 TsaB [Mogibacterium sp.]|nr:tRNA (adenosine(37)-N6)-threonylcarbamoyltransferase complex dimerization subunit type 1 TsaB [Mogibacterium sp.]
MNILAIETTGKYGSASVIKETGEVFSAISTEEMNHLKGMMILIDEAIREAGIDKSELTHIAASVGPGSFTGIRIGVVTARVMAQMLGLPCISVSSLEAMAERVLDAAVSAGSLYVVPVINARRHQTYAGVWEAEFTSDYEQKTLCAVMEEKQYMIEDLLAALSSKIAELEAEASGRAQSLKDMLGNAVFFTGDGIDAYKEIIESSLPDGLYTFAGEELRYQHAESVARIALRKAKADRVLSYNELMPEYMRLAEAEQRLKAGTLSDRIRKPVQI